jgi:hypothetical protein
VHRSSSLLLSRDWWESECWEALPAAFPEITSRLAFDSIHLDDAPESLTFAAVGSEQSWGGIERRLHAPILKVDLCVGNRGGTPNQAAERNVRFRGKITMYESRFPPQFVVSRKPAPVAGPTPRDLGQRCEWIGPFC